MITRRDAAWAITCAIAAGPEFFASWSSAAQTHVHDATPQAPPEPDRFSHYQPQFFSRDEFTALDVFTAILIPTDDTPGAREAHVAAFIDFVLFSAAEFAPEMQNAWRDALHRLDPPRFNQLSPAAQFAAVERMSSESSAAHPDFQLIKEMTVHAFYTSRAGLIDTLEYKGNAYLTEFPGCNHPEHHQL
jgi:Gluconate 2-dehydrogenase subunit 3